VSRPHANRVGHSGEEPDVHERPAAAETEKAAPRPSVKPPLAPRRQWRIKKRDAVPALVRRLRAGAGTAGGPGWRRILRTQAASIVACDFTVENVLVRRHDVLFIAHAHRCRRTRT
jgi:hypothetical protein